MQSNSASTSVTKPGSIKAVIGLTIFKIFLSLGFYIVFATETIVFEGFDPNLILYTMGGYALMALPIIYFTQKRNMWGTRISILVDLAISVPILAAAGMLISLISFGLTFSKGARSYWS